MEKNNGILRKIYNGELYPKEDFPKEENFLKLCKEKNEIANKLLMNFNESDKELFHKYIEIEATTSSLDSENQFLQGFKLATQIIIESLTIRIISSLLVLTI